MWMSDLFAELGNFRFPDTRMNQGPLPSVVGGPAGSDGTPDSRINRTNELLRNITPYAYGKAARMGSDRNYQQVPHRVQQIVQQVAVPDPHGSTWVHIPHVVDNGELAFVVLTARSVLSTPYHLTGRNNPATIPQFANLEVVNYILCCLQMEENRTGAGSNLWHQVLEELTSGQIEHRENGTYLNFWKNGTCWPGKARPDASECANFYFELASYLISNIFIPFGICAGSEKQGGQHEGGYAPVQSAVNYVTTMTVDGQNRDLMNYWHGRTINAGDRLILGLQGMAFEANHSMRFSLNSYYKKPVAQSVVVGEQPFWQLRPHVYGSGTDLEVPGIALDAFDYRFTQYWHVAQTFQCRKGDKNIRSFEIAPPLQVTFSPVLQRMDSYAAPGAAAAAAAAARTAARVAAAAAANATAAAAAAAAAARARGGRVISGGIPTTLSQRSAQAIAAARQAQAQAVAARSAAAAAATSVARARVSGPIPACLANWGTIPEIQAILLFYGIYVLEVNGEMSVDRSYFDGNAAEQGMFDDVIVIRNTWKASANANKTIEALLSTIDSVRNIAPGLIVTLRNSAAILATSISGPVLAPNIVAQITNCAVPNELQVASLNTFYNDLNGIVPGTTQVQDEELRTFIQHMCRDPFLYYNRGVQNNLQIKPVLLCLSVYNLCRLRLQLSDGTRHAIYDKFASLTSDSITQDLVAYITSTVGDGLQADACTAYYTGRSKLQKAIQVLNLNDHTNKMKDIANFESRITTYWNALKALDSSEIEPVMAAAVAAANAGMTGGASPAAQAALNHVATRSPPLQEIADVLVNCTGMTAVKNQKAIAFNAFTRLYNDSIAALQTTTPDYESDIPQKMGELNRTAVHLTAYYECVSEFVIYTALYCRAMHIFFARTPTGGLLGGPVHTLYTAYYNTAGHVTDAAHITQLEAIRNNATMVTWLSAFANPTIKLSSDWAESMRRLVASFPAFGGLLYLLEYMLTNGLMPDVLSVATGAAGLDHPALQTFKHGGRQFSLATALSNVATAEDTALASIGDGAGAGAAGSSGSTGSVLSKPPAPARRAKKIRFELDDARCPTITEEPGGAASQGGIGH